MTAPAPASVSALFVAFSRLALQGFGGVLPVAQRELVERLGWLSKDEFVELLATAQALPGPNVVNLSMMVGDRYFGLRGALAALAGMLALPASLVLLLAALLSQLTTQAWVQDALRGMGMVSAGLILATGLKLLPLLRTHPLGRPLALALAVLGFGAVVLLHWPLVVVIGVLGPIGIALAWRRLPLIVNGMESAWLELLLHFLALSLLAIGGAITTVPEMHRYLVTQRGWLGEADFTSAIALAQAAPGPNLLFVVVLGYQVAGLAGAAASLAGMLLPSATLTLAATRWARANREWRGVRAFNAGMTPLTLGLILSSGWLLAAPFVRAPEHRWSSGALMVLTIALTLRTRINLVWLVLGGGVLGVLGVV